MASSLDNPGWGVVDHVCKGLKNFFKNYIPVPFQCKIQLDKNCTDIIFITRLCWLLNHNDFMMEFLYLNALVWVKLHSIFTQHTTNFYFFSN